MKCIFKLNMKRIMGIAKIVLLTGFLWPNFLQGQSFAKQDTRFVCHLKRHGFINEPHPTRPYLENLFSEALFSGQLPGYNTPINLQTHYVNTSALNKLTFMQYHAKKSHPSGIQYTFSKDFAVTQPKNTALLSLKQAGNGVAESKVLSVKVSEHGSTTKTGIKVGWRLSNHSQSSANVVLSAAESVTDQNGVASVKITVQQTIGAVSVSVFASAPDGQEKEYVVVFPPLSVELGDLKETCPTQLVVNTRKIKKCIAVTVKINGKVAQGVHITWQFRGAAQHNTSLVSTNSDNHGIATAFAYATSPITSPIIIEAIAPDNNTKKDIAIQFCHGQSPYYYISDVGRRRYTTLKNFNFPLVFMDQSLNPLSNQTIRWESPDTDVTVDNVSSIEKPTTTGGVSTVTLNSSVSNLSSDKVYGIKFSVLDASSKVLADYETGLLMKRNISSPDYFVDDFPRHAVVNKVDHTLSVRLVKLATNFGMSAGTNEKIEWESLSSNLQIGNSSSKQNMTDAHGISSVSIKASVPGHYSIKISLLDNKGNKVFSINKKVPVLGFDLGVASICNHDHNNHYHINREAMVYSPTLYWIDEDFNDIKIASKIAERWEVVQDTTGSIIQPSLPQNLLAVSWGRSHIIVKPTKVGHLKLRYKKMLVVNSKVVVSGTIELDSEN